MTSQLVNDVEDNAASFSKMDIEEDEDVDDSISDAKSGDAEDIPEEDEDYEDENVWLLGYTQKPEKPWSLARHHFPSKAGGTPAWLEPQHLPRPEQSCCVFCGKPLDFLLQIYAPVEGAGEAAFHRTLHMFVCRNMACLRQDARHLAEAGAASPAKRSWCGTWGADKRCAGCHLAHYCCRTHQVEHWRSGHAAFCREMQTPGAAGGGTTAGSGSDADAGVGAAGAGADAAASSARVAQAQAPPQQLAKPAAAAAAPAAAAPLALGPDSCKAAAAAPAGNAAEEQGQEQGQEQEQGRLLPERERPRLHQLASGGHRLATEAQPGVAPAANPQIWPEFELIVEEEEEEEGTARAMEEEEGVGGRSRGNDGAAAAQPDRAEQLLAEYKSRTAVEGEYEPKELAGLEEESAEKQHWASFQACLARAPSQVIRYCRAAGAKPMWARLDGQPAEGQVSPCVCCGSPRVFEFQVLPQLLYFLRVETAVESDSLDFGVLAVYTCERSCDPTTITTSGASASAYVEEFVWTQLPP
eukprot:jgi/Mesen1/5080/ME000252S04195